MPEIRQRMLFTMGALIVYRLGSHIVVPGIDATALAEMWEQLSGRLGARKGEDSLFKSRTMFNAARIVGRALREVDDADAEYVRA